MRRRSLPRFTKTPPMLYNISEPTLHQVNIIITYIYVQRPVACKTFPSVHIIMHACSRSTRKGKYTQKVKLVCMLILLLQLLIVEIQLFFLRRGEGGEGIRKGAKR